MDPRAFVVASFAAKAPPGQGIDANAFHLIPLIAVNQVGAVSVAWYDRRSDPANLRIEVCASASIDGGVSFSPNVRVSGERACAPDNGRGSEMQKWNVGGEYAGVASAADGSFHIVWSDVRSGTFQLWTARVLVELGAQDGERGARLGWASSSWKSH